MDTTAEGRAIQDDRLEYSSVPSTPARLSRLAIAATLSIAAGIFVVLLAFIGWEVQLRGFPGSYRPEIHKPLYHNGNIYCLNPFWIASFSLMIPAIWLKRRFIDRLGAKNAALRSFADRNRIAE